MDAIEELAARYVAVWNEPDAAVRDAAVAGLWSAVRFDYQFIDF
jgi:hypothetical protein